MIDGGALRDLYGRIGKLEHALERRRVEMPRTLRGRIYYNTTQSMGNATVTQVLFNTYRVTPSAGATASASAWVFSEAGWWTGGVHIDFAANVTGDRHVYVQHQPSGLYIAIDDRMAVTTGQPTLVSLTFGYEMAAGDSILVQAYQASGGALNILSAPAYTPEFWVEKTG